MRGGDTLFIASALVVCKCVTLSYQLAVSDRDYACPGEMIDSKILGVNSFSGAICYVPGPSHLLIFLIILSSLLVGLL